MYCSVNDVLLSSEISVSDERRIVRAIEAASARIDAMCIREDGFFRPTEETRVFDVPGDYQTSPYFKLYLDATAIVSVSSVLVEGIDVTSDVLLEPSKYGAPYSRIDLDTKGFGYGARVVSVTGVWGYPERSDLAGAVASDDGGTVTVVPRGNYCLSTGDVMLIGTERLEVTSVYWIDSGATLSADVASSTGEMSLQVDDPSDFLAGERIVIGSERMLVTSVVGTTITVRRATDGSALSSHTTGDAVYVPRKFSVSRSGSGTHAADTAVNVLRPPADIVEATVAETVSIMAHGRSSYTDDFGPSGTSVTVTGAAPLTDLRDLVMRRYGRSCRTRVV
jgi:hypothetical protein